MKSQYFLSMLFVLFTFDLLAMPKTNYYADSLDRFFYSSENCNYEEWTKKVNEGISEIIEEWEDDYFLNLNKEKYDEKEFYEAKNSVLEILLQRKEEESVKKKAEKISENYDAVENSILEGIIQNLKNNYSSMEIAEAIRKWDEAYRSLKTEAIQSLSKIENNIKQLMSDIFNENQNENVIKLSSQKIYQNAVREVQDYFIKERNSFFYSINHDVDSLRRLSEYEDCSEVSDKILKDTEKLSNEIITGLENQFSNEEIPDIYVKENIDKLILLWENAENNLILSKLKFQEENESASKELNEKWSKAYEDLVVEKNKCMQKLRSAYLQGKEKWSQENESFNEKMKIEEETFEEYINRNLSDANKYTANIYAIMSNSNNWIGRTYEDLLWLNDYYNNVSDLGLSENGYLNDIENQIEFRRNTINRINELIDSYEKEIYSERLYSNSNNDGLFKDEVDDEVLEYYDSSGVLLFSGKYNQNNLYYNSLYELKCKLNKLEKDYYYKKLKEAEAVYNYAVNENNRPSEDETVMKYKKAEEKLNKLKEEYSKFLGEFEKSEIVKLEEIQSDLNVLFNQLDAVNMEYDEIQTEFSKISSRYFVNCDNAKNNAKKELEKAKQEYLDLLESSEDDSYYKIMAKERFLKNEIDYAESFLKISKENKNYNDLIKIIIESKIKIQVNDDCSEIINFKKEMQRYKELEIYDDLFSDMINYCDNVVEKYYLLLTSEESEIEKNKTKFQNSKRILCEQMNIVSNILNQNVDYNNKLLLGEDVSVLKKNILNESYEAFDLFQKKKIEFQKKIISDLIYELENNQEENVEFIIDDFQKQHSIDFVFPVFSSNDQIYLRARLIDEFKGKLKIIDYVECIGNKYGYSKIKDITSKYIINNYCYKRDGDYFYENDNSEKEDVLSLNDLIFFNSVNSYFNNQFYFFEIEENSNLDLINYDMNAKMNLYEKIQNLSEINKSNHNTQNVENNQLSNITYNELEKLIKEKDLLSNECIATEYEKLKAAIDLKNNDCSLDVLKEDIVTAVDSNKDFLDCIQEIYEKYNSSSEPNKYFQFMFSIKESLLNFNSDIENSNEIIEKIDYNLIQITKHYQYKVYKEIIESGLEITSSNVEEKSKELFVPQQIISEKFIADVLNLQSENITEEVREGIIELLSININSLEDYNQAVEKYRLNPFEKKVLFLKYSNDDISMYSDSFSITSAYYKQIVKSKFGFLIERIFGEDSIYRKISSKISQLQKKSFIIDEIDSEENIRENFKYLNSDDDNLSKTEIQISDDYDSNYHYYSESGKTDNYILSKMHSIISQIIIGNNLYDYYLNQNEVSQTDDRLEELKDKYEKVLIQKEHYDNKLITLKNIIFQNSNLINNIDEQSRESESLYSDKKQEYESILAKKENLIHDIITKEGQLNEIKEEYRKKLNLINAFKIEISKAREKYDIINGVYEYAQNSLIKGSNEDSGENSYVDAELYYNKAVEKYDEVLKKYNEEDLIENEKKGQDEKYYDLKGYIDEYKNAVLQSTLVETVTKDVQRRKKNIETDINKIEFEVNETIEDIYCTNLNEEIENCCDYFLDYYVKDVNENISLSEEFDSGLNLFACYYNEYHDEIFKTDRTLFYGIPLVDGDKLLKEENPFKYIVTNNIEGFDVGQNIFVDYAREKLKYCEYYNKYQRLDLKYLNCNKSYLYLKSKYDKIRRKGKKSIFKKAFYYSLAESFAVASGMYVQKAMLNTILSDITNYRNKYILANKRSEEIKNKIKQKLISIKKMNLLKTDKQNELNAISLQGKSSVEITQIYKNFANEANSEIVFDTQNFHNSIYEKNLSSYQEIKDVFLQNRKQKYFAAFSKVNLNQSDSNNRYIVENFLKDIYSQFKLYKDDFRGTENYKKLLEEYFILIEGIDDSLFQSNATYSEILNYGNIIYSNLFEKAIEQERMLYLKKNDLEYKEFDSFFEKWNHRIVSTISRAMKQWNSVFDTFFEKRKISLHDFENNNQNKSKHLDKLQSKISKIKTKLIKDSVGKLYQDSIRNLEESLEKSYSINCEIVQIENFNQPKGLVEEAIAELKESYSDEELDKMISDIYYNSESENYYNSLSFNIVRGGYSEIKNSISNQITEITKFKLLDSIRKLISDLKYQLKRINKNASNISDKYAFSKDYYKKNGFYVKKSRKVYGCKKTIKIKPYRALSLDNININENNLTFNKYDFSSYTMSDLNLLVNDRIYSILNTFNNYNFSGYIGEFPFINEKGKKENNGVGEFGRIGSEMYDEEESEKYFKLIVSGVETASIVGLTIYNPLYGFGVSQYLAMDEVIENDDYSFMDYSSNLLLDGSAAALSFGVSEYISEAAVPIANYLWSGWKYDDGDFDYRLEDRDLVNLITGVVGYSVSTNIDNKYLSEGLNSIIGQGQNFMSFDEENNVDGFITGKDQIASSIVDVAINTLFELDCTSSMDNSWKNYFNQLSSNSVKVILGQILNLDMTTHVGFDSSSTLDIVMGMLVRRGINEFLNQQNIECNKDAVDVFKIMQLFEDLAGGLYLGLKENYERIKNYYDKNIFMSDSELDALNFKAMKESVAEAAAENFKADTSKVKEEYDLSLYTEEEKVQFLKDKIEDIKLHYTKDSKNETNRKIIVLKKAGLDTSEIEKWVIDKRIEAEKRRKEKLRKLKEKREREKKYYSQFIHSYDMDEYLNTAKRQKIDYYNNASYIYSGGLNRSLYYEKFNGDIEKITDPNMMGQWGDAPVRTIFTDVYESIKSDEEINSHLNYVKGKSAIDYEKYKKIIDYILETDSKTLAAQTATASCCIESYWIYSVAMGYNNLDFKQFYMSELLKGNIGRVKNNGQTDLFFGSGTSLWQDQYNMKREVPGDGITIGDRREIVDELNESGKRYAVVAYDYKGRGYGHHYLVIAKNKQGEWYMYDHCPNPQTREKQIDWSKTYCLYY